MDAHSLRVLEYDKIKAMLGRYLSTELGREVLEALQPDSDPARVREQLRVTTEARHAIDQLLEAPLDPVYDLRPLLARLAPEGAYLDPRELLRVRETLQTVRRAVEFCRNLPVAMERLRRWGGELLPQEELEEAIARTIDEEAQVRDSASRQLKAIRGSIREVRDWITRRLERMLRKPRWREYLQEPYFTQREGRYVLPVQTQFKSKVRGIVHDCSDTGTTTFIEPAEIVEQGNRLRELVAEEEVEVRKILRQVSALVRRAAEPIRHNLDLLAQLDFAFAKGRLSAVHRMLEPEVTAEGVLKIRGGRHPLLLETLRDKVVPLDLTLGDRCRAMVITGPNTGGKTVVLKTAGILCLMAASGLHLPAEDGTRIVLYPKVFADIGDEQSLEQSLSTFSSHMNQISKLITLCDSGTLVLLDELGTGTDPVEGGALGVAILGTLVERGAHALVTTHLNELKVYAYETEGIDNGGMAFDSETLQPTYQLLPGTPGSSYALDIATRLGLAEEVIAKARSRLEGDREDAEALLERLSADTRRAADALREAEGEREKAERLRLDLARRLDHIDREKGHIQERARHEARSKLEDLERAIREVEDELERVLEAARTAAAEEVEAAGEKIAELKKQQLALRLKAKEEFKPPPEPPQWEPVAPERLEAGQLVHLKGFTQPGRLVAVDLKRSEAEVHIQSVQLRIPLGRILGILRPEEKPEAKPAEVGVEVSKSDDLPRSLDIHGLTLDEALPRLEKYLDTAHLAAWPEVYIIHGVGTGTLRRMVQATLSKHPLVASFRPGDYFEGGQGVTVAKLHPK